MKFLIVVVLLVAVVLGNLPPQVDLNAPPKNAAVLTFRGKVAKCNFEVDGGYCDNWQPRYSYRPESGKCIQHNWSGCGGNDNNFKTEAECIKVCVPNKRG